MTWEPNSSGTWADDSEIDRYAALLGNATVFGVPFHVTAIRVVYNDSGIQEAEDCAYDGDLEHVFALCGDGPLMTCNLPGYQGDYVLVFYPYAS